MLTQKGLPKLALVQPRVDLDQGVMQVRSQQQFDPLVLMALCQFKHKRVDFSVFEPLLEA